MWVQWTRNTYFVTFCIVIFKWVNFKTAIFLKKEKLSFIYNNREKTVVTKNKEITIY